MGIKRKYNLFILLVILFITIFIIGCSSIPETSIPETSINVENSLLTLPSDALLVLDTGNSKLLWQASRLASKPHIGTVNISQGVLLRKNNQFVKGEFIIDMATITDEKNNGKFLSHIHGEDFFNVVKYPLSKLVITDVLETEKEGDYVINADLTILDQTNKIKFPAKLSTKGDKVKVIAVFEIDRTLWGIIYDSGSFASDLGDRAIKNEIKFALDLQFDIQKVSNEKINVFSSYNAIGNPNATVTLIEYSDYQCPFCKKFTLEILPLIHEEYIETGKVKFIFKDFPLEIHKEARQGAVAAHCAGEQGEYFAYHDILFENSKIFSQENFVKWAGEIGLNTVDFEVCLDDKKILTKIDQSAIEAKIKGVSGTPSFLINEVLLTGAQPFAVFKQVIDSQLGKEPVNLEKVKGAVCLSDDDCLKNMDFGPYCSQTNKNEFCYTSSTQECKLPGTSKSECVVMISEECIGCPNDDICNEGKCVTN